MQTGAQLLFGLLHDFVLIGTAGSLMTKQDLSFNLDVIVLAASLTVRLEDLQLPVMHGVGLQRQVTLELWNCLETVVGHIRAALGLKRLLQNTKLFLIVLVQLSVVPFCNHLSRKFSVIWPVGESGLDRDCGVVISAAVITSPCLLHQLLCLVVPGVDQLWRLLHAVGQVLWQVQVV